MKKRLDDVYGDCAPSYATVKEFQLGRESVEDVPHEGRPVEVLTPETINIIEQEALSDRRLKIREIAERLDLSKGTVHRAFLDHLHIKKILDLIF
jgi:DNA-binding NarL/FixJ family response regulator